MKTISERDVDIICSILDHCDRITEIVKRIDSSWEKYSKDIVFKDAIKMNIFQIGELSNHLSDEFKELTAEISWHKIYGTRNIIAHGYIMIDERIIWNTVLKDIPELKNKLLVLLED